MSRKYNATHLAIAFVASLMLPILVLAYTEHYPFRVTLASILIPLGAYLMFSALSSRSGRMVWAGFVFFFLSAFQIVLSYLFGNSVIASDMFLNVMTTNPGEASELLSNIYPSIIFVCIVYIPILWKASRHLIHNVELKDAARRGLFAYGFVSFILGAVVLNAGGEKVNTREEVLNDIFPVNAFYNLALSISEAHKINNYYTTSRDFTYGAWRDKEAPRREVYVLVIGEASRAANWQLYGYTRRTNPRLAARRDFTLFNGVTTLSNTTHKSVPMMLSSIAPEEHNMLYRRKGLPALFNEAGFTTYFISNQSPQGAMVDCLVADANHLIYMDSPGYDMQMVDKMNEVLKSDPSQKILFILHSYGSHFSYHQRYPREMAKYLPDDDVAITKKNMEYIRNAYDNSIVYTDYFLDAIMNSLKQHRDVCSAMFYCSDHGEDLMDDKHNRFLHSSPYTTYYQLHVASLAWFSPAYAHYFADKVAAARLNASVAATTHSVFHTIADIASIRSEYVKLSVSLVSDSFDNTISRSYVNDHNEAVALDKHIGIDAMQQALFRQAGISLP